MLMSEDAGATADPGTGDAGQVTDGAETASPEDDEAAGLLGGMLANDPETLAAELGKWKGEARKWEGRAKKNSDAAAELESIKQQNMSDLEKAQAAAAQAAEERDKALAMHARVMAAAAHNLPVELIDHLGSGTEDEINERAEQFARVIETAAQDRANEILAQNAGRNGMPVTGARPVQSMRPGSAPAVGGETPTTPDEWFRRLLDTRNQ
jgi:Domain of unknown function (DUF4355)